jgi:hypothetical protein
MLQRPIAHILTPLLLTHLGPGSFAGQIIATEIKAMPVGKTVEVRLKTRENLRGTTGAASASSFTLTDTSAVDRQLAV